MVNVDAPRMVAAPSFIPVEIPPPPIAAMVHCINGDISGATDAVARVPAIAAVGVAIASSILSNQGI